jgi:hypothetical protein
LLPPAAEANNEALAEMQDKLKDLERLASDRMSEIAELRWASGGRLFDGWKKGSS